MQTSQLTRFRRVTHDFKPHLTISQHGLVFTRRWLGNNSWIKQINSLNNVWTILLSRFNNTCWIHNVDEYCSINSCLMLTENNSCYNVVRTWADNSWWKKLVDRCQQWLNNGCWTWTTVNNGGWQQLLTGWSTTLLNSVQHNIATSCWQHWSSCSFLHL